MFTVQFLPHRQLQVGQAFFQQWLPGYMEFGGAYHSQSYQFAASRRRRRANVILQNYFEELYYYGRSQYLLINLEILWRRDYQMFLANNLWPGATPFASVFTDLAGLLSPNGAISSYICFQSMSNFYMQHFDEMIDMSPQTALVCFNALDWMGRSMDDLCTIAGQHISFLRELEELQVPYLFRDRTLELLANVRDQYLPHYGCRHRNPWHHDHGFKGRGTAHMYCKPHVAFAGLPQFILPQLLLPGIELPRRTANILGPVRRSLFIGGGRGLSRADLGIDRPTQQPFRRLRWL